MAYFKFEGVPLPSYLCRKYTVSFYPIIGSSQTTALSAILNIYPTTLTESIIFTPPPWLKVFLLLKLQGFIERIVVQRTINISKNSHYPTPENESYNTAFYVLPLNLILRKNVKRAELRVF